MKSSRIERVYGYTGASGLIQAFAAGYFLWDFVVSTLHFKIFGPGIWAHSITALAVFSLGFVGFLSFLSQGRLFADMRPSDLLPTITVLSLSFTSSPPLSLTSIGFATSSTSLAQSYSGTTA